MSKGRIYRRTAEGHKALMESTIGMAGGEYRRLLDLTAEDMHFDAIRAALPHHPDALIARWLRELESRGLLASAPDTAEQDLDFTASFKLRAARS